MPALAADQLSVAFSALADPTRRAMLARLAHGEATVGEIGRPFAISGPAVTKHLKVLEHAGLITRSRQAQRRPARLEPQALQAVTRWLDDYRKFWEQGFDRLDDYLAELQKKED